MQIVIDIPEEMWEWLHNGFLDEDDGKHAINAIIKGTPLPKGHGELIDKNDLSLMTVHLIDGMFVCDAPTIIEADKGEEDGK